MRESDIKKQIDAYVKGRLSEEEIEALWVELAKNPDLLKTLEVEVAAKKHFESHIDVTESRSKIHPLKPWIWHISAAAVILLVAMLQLFRTETPTELHEFVVADIQADQIETTDALRSDDTSSTKADSLLNLGFNAFMAGEYEQALMFFKQIIDEFNDPHYLAKAYLNTGIIYYNRGNYEEAEAAFSRAAEHSEEIRMIAEKAWWYLGNTLVNTGELQRAHDAVYKTYQMDGVFRSQAFRLLIKLNEELGYHDYEEEPSE